MANRKPLQNYYVDCREMEKDECQGVKTELDYNQLSNECERVEHWAGRIDEVILRRKFQSFHCYLIENQETPDFSSLR